MVADAGGLRREVGERRQGGRQRDGGPRARRAARRGTDATGWLMNCGVDDAHCARAHCARRRADKPPPGARGAGRAAAREVAYETTWTAARIPQPAVAAGAGGVAPDRRPARWPAKQRQRRAGDGDPRRREGGGAQEARTWWPTREVGERRQGGRRGWPAAGGDCDARDATRLFSERATTRRATTRVAPTGRENDEGG
jgi:hypothetical protein